MDKEQIEKKVFKCLDKLHDLNSQWNSSLSECTYMTEGEEDFKTWLEVMLYKYEN